LYLESATRPTTAVVTRLASESAELDRSEMARPDAMILQRLDLLGLQTPSFEFFEQDLECEGPLTVHSSVKLLEITFSPATFQVACYDERGGSLPDR
jgi:hypothetical protein